MQPTGYYSTRPAQPWATEAVPLKAAADRFVPQQRCHDPFFAVLMVVHLVATLAIAATDLPSLHFDASTSEAAPHLTAKGVAVTLVPAVLMGAASVGLALTLMRRHARLMFNLMFGASIGLLCLDMLLLFASGHLSG